MAAIISKIDELMEIEAMFGNASSEEEFDYIAGIRRERQNLQNQLGGMAA